MGSQVGKRMSASSKTVVYNVNGTRFEVDARYQPIKPVGKGAYGLVCSAQDLTTGKKVAIKKVPRAFDDIVDGKRILREIKLMKFCNHENVRPSLPRSCCASRRRIVRPRRSPCRGRVCSTPVYFLLR